MSSATILGTANQQSDMNVKHINPFVTSTVSVFSTMLDCKVVRGDLRVKLQSQPEYEISGIIGLSGKATGTVILSLDRHVALLAAEAMLGEPHPDLNADVIDLIGELTNMIAGAAKAELEELEMSISLPSVIIGRNHIIKFPSKTTPICVPFESPWGPLCLEVGLLE